MVAHKLNNTGLTFKYDKEDPYKQYNGDSQSNADKTETKGSWW